MQIIQGIREKGAAITIVVIAISLIGFILMDSGNNKMFGSSTSTDIAIVNGESIELLDFNAKVEEAVQAEKQNQNQFQQPRTTYQIKDQVYNTMVALKIFYAEVEKLGIAFTPEEMRVFLYSTEPANPFMQGQGFLDSLTGRPDPAKISAKLKEIKKATSPDRVFFNTQIDAQRQASIVGKYNGLLNAAAYYPTWMLERENSNSKNFAAISYVSIPYGVVPDSTVKVSDEDVQSYVDAHKKLFKQEAGRMVSYVTFSQLPRVEDSAKTLKEVSDLKAAFEADSNNSAFLAKNNSRLPYTDDYIAKSKLPTTKADSIVKLAPGTVYGPYIDYGSYIMAKYVGSKLVLDSIKCRHILIKAEGALNDSAAHKLADSIASSVKSGVDFNTLETLYSKDEAAHRDKGVMTFDMATIKNPQGFSPEFAAFLLNEAGESKKVVKTSFGWHYIEILEKKNNLGYKVAFLAREIEAGENSLNVATQDAIKLSATKKSKDFEVYLQKNGIVKTTLPNLIKETDDQVGALTGARQLVNWVYNASVGDVSEPFLIDDNQVVVVLEKVYKEGTQDIKAARPLAERAIKNKKIAALIIKKITPTATLESAAAAYNQPVQVAGADSTIIYNTTLINGLNEPKLVGATFNKENQSKASAPIEGASGVYLVKVNSMGTKAANTPEETAQKIQSQTTNLRQQVTVNWYEGLKSQATVKDRRGKVNY